MLNYEVWDHRCYITRFGTTFAKILDLGPQMLNY